MKNIDKIRQMTSEELAEWLYRKFNDIDYPPCGICAGECFKCKDGVKQWLKQEVEE